MYRYEIRHNVRAYTFQEGRGDLSWKTDHFEDDSTREPTHYLCLDTYADAFAHWVFESAIYLPLFQILKRSYPSCKLWFRNKRDYKYLFTRYFGIADTDVVFQTSQEPNICFFPEPIMWLNSASDPRWEQHVQAFHGYFHGVVPKKVDVCVLPRQTKENAVYCPRTYTLTPICDSLRERRLSHTICETDTVKTLDEQIKAVRSARTVIVTDGSPFWVNGFFSTHATLIILGHDCKKLAREHERYNYLYRIILEHNKIIHTVQYHRPTDTMIDDTFTWEDVAQLLPTPGPAPMHVFVNGFWGGFLERTDGVHVGVFERLFQSVFETEVIFTNNIHEADSLLESHFAPSVFGLRPWVHSVFFSGEGSIPLPAHASQYTFVLGAQPTDTNYVPLPLAVCYDLCKPFVYPTTHTTVPPNDVCAVISSPVKDGRYRTQFIDELRADGIQVDMWGHYQNNMGRTVEGTYYEEPIRMLQSTYKIVLALENTELDNYITEKVLNPLRAGTIPVYYGSSRIDEYICADRILQVTPETVQQTISEIRRYCKDEDAWRKKVSGRIFETTSQQVLDNAIERCINIVNKKPYCVELIGNEQAEPERAQSLLPIRAFYDVTPRYEVYGADAYHHPLYRRFDSTKKINAISLAINHITCLKKYANTNQYVVLFESDAIPLYDMDTIHAQILEDIEHMKQHTIDFAFIGHGCCSPPSEKHMIGSHMYRMSLSRCTESYIASPQGIRHFLEWFYSKRNHDVIDWAFNHYCKDHPERVFVWRTPELFKQGSICGLYNSLVPT